MRGSVRRLVAGSMILIATLWTLVHWVEAEKEVLVLCALSGPGTTEAELQRLVGTAALTRLADDTVVADRTVRMSSGRNLSLTGCTVAVEDGVVIHREYRERLRLAPLTGLRASLELDGGDARDGSRPAPARPLAGQTVVGALTVLSLAGYLVSLGLARARARWVIAAATLAMIGVGVVLLLGS